MNRHRAHASARIGAPAERVYAILADYRQEHPAILPPRYFRRLEVEAGGVGAGTRTSLEMRVLGTVRRFRQVVTEPEPGRVLVESDLDASTTTTFTVDPSDEGRAADVTIETEFTTSGGLRGTIEGRLTAWMLRRIYAEELTRLTTRVCAGSSQAGR